MRMAKRLIIAAHHAEGHLHPAIAGHHARDDRVQWSLRGANTVWMTGFNREALAAIVQYNARTWRHEARAETVEDRIDEAHGIAVTVDDRDIDGVAMKRHFERRQVGQRFLQVDHRREPVGQRIRQQLIDWYFRLVRIGDPGVTGGIRQACCLDLDMQPVRRLRVA